MRKKYLYAFGLCLALFLTGCSETTTDPVPGSKPNEDGVVVEIRFTNPSVPTYNFVALHTRATLCETSVRQGGTALIDKRTNFLDPPAPVWPVGLSKRHVHFALMFTDITHARYPLPANGQYVQADLLFDGVVKHSLRLDENAVNNQANYWRVDANTTHIIREIDFDM